jgi:hypothetical protein
MKTFLYYLAISIPLALIYALSLNYGRISLIIGLLIYLVVYRPIVDFYRLQSKGVDISLKDIYLKIFFYYHIKYFKKLYS